MSRIIVKNLPPSGITEEELKKHFSDIDNLTDVKLQYTDFGEFRRFAFIGFKSPDAAEKAVEKLNKTFIKNNRIILEQCKSVREIKPNKVGYAVIKELKQDNQVEDGNIHEDVSDDANRKPNKRKKNKTNVFEEVKDNAEFKEFLSLQRNVGENSKSKQIWADDAVNDVDEMKHNSDSNIVDKVENEKEESDKQKTIRKKHKRSRGKKKLDKTKPKELFVHTLKMSGFPENTRRKDVMDFFKPLKLLSVRINKRDAICFASFKDDSDLRFAMRKNLQFWGTSRIKLWKHSVKKSRIFKETLREKVKQKEEINNKYVEVLKSTEPVEESGRLFVRNLNYTCTQEDLESIFTPFGELSEVHFPIDKNTSMPKGYAYVEFVFPDNAKRAYEELNGTIFQGRNFHLIPSKPKPEPVQRPDSYNYNNSKFENQSSYKRDQLREQKKSAIRATSNWNILFLGQNALADVVSDRKGVDKSKLLTQQTHKDPIAVRMALGDASVVDEMRKFLISNGIELDSFDNPQTPRSRTVIIVKNLPSGVEKSEVSQLFEQHGRVSRVIMPPNGLTVIVEMEEPVEAKLAFKKLAYSKFKESILYLEWAPINVFREKSLDEQERSDVKQLEELQTGTKILVKNIPFEATPQEVKKIFASFGELNFVRIPKKIDGQHRGFGFVDYLTKEDALRAFRSLCHSTHLYGRKLVLEWAKAEDNNNSGNQTSGTTSTKHEDNFKNNTSSNGYDTSAKRLLPLPVA